ncbi:cytosine methylase, phage-associated domain protein [Pseudomonas aeruginosa]|nr:cytosine methylase, phage-associated domain protein [Pseudomonas aeruginosa]
MNILDRSFVDVARCYVAGGDQVSKPLSGIWVEFVVVGARHGVSSGGRHRMQLHCPMRWPVVRQ